MLKGKRIAQNNSESEDNHLGYDFMKKKLDPLHTMEQKGLLKIFPTANIASSVMFFLFLFVYHWTVAYCHSGSQFNDFFKTT